MPILWQILHVYFFNSIINKYMKRVIQILADIRANAFSKAFDVALILPDDPKFPRFVPMLKLFLS